MRVCVCDDVDDGGKIPLTIPNCPELETLEPDPLRAGSLPILETGHSSAHQYHQHYHHHRHPHLARACGGRKGSTVFHMQLLCDMAAMICNVPN